MAGRSTELENERLARHIVSTVLGVPVCRFEDGTAPRQVDALIRYPHREAALEIVTDPDEHFHRRQAELHHNPTIEVTSVPDSWMVVLSREADPKKVTKALPKLLPALRDNLPTKRQRLDIKPSELVRLHNELVRLGIKPSELDRLGVKPSELDRLGIISAELIENGPPGHVRLNIEAWGVGTGDERTVGDWVTEVLVKKASDVPEKLAAHPGVAERHAFVWAIPTSDRGVLAQLEPGDDHPLPVAPPTLPVGVTHVWVAGLTWSSHGVLAWFPDRGWWRPSWTRPSERL